MSGGVLWSMPVFVSVSVSVSVFVSVSVTVSVPVTVFVCVSVSVSVSVSDVDDGQAPRRVDAAEVFASAAYLLFYERARM